MKSIELARKNENQGIRNGFRFLQAFLKNPKLTGGVMRSSRGLTTKMLEGVDWEKVETIVEFGPGTGAFTESILRHMRPDAKYFAVEINEGFVDIFHERFPGVKIFRDSAEHVKDLCHQEGIEKVDLLISGLPWAWLSPDLQQRTLGAALSVLRPGGSFRTFAHVHGAWMSAGREFRKLLQHSFPKVESSPVVWSNLPPAFVYRCSTGAKSDEK